LYLLFDLLELVLHKRKEIYVNKIAQNLSILMLPLLALIGFTVKAEEAQTPQVVEAFQCTYNQGKDWDDVMSARDYYLKQAGKAGITPPPAYVWSLYKGSPPVDFIWFNVHDDLAAFGAYSDAGAASSDMASVLPRFYTVATCQEGLGYLNSVFQRGEEGDEPDTSLLSSYACNYRHGAGPDARPDLNRHIGEVLGGMGEDAPQSVYTLDPITTGPNSSDLYLLDIHDNATAWTNFQGALTSGAGPALGRHFQSVLDCDQSLWNLQQVVGDDG
jgi:hypothetical protein